MRKQLKAVNILKMRCFIHDILKTHEVTVRMLRLAFAHFLTLFQHTTKATDLQISNAVISYLQNKNKLLHKSLQ
jgi:hypothetical protein